MKVEKSLGSGYDALSNAIIKLAAQDYIRALKSLKRNSRSRVARQEKEEIEYFFQSAWYACLTNVDGEYLIQRLKEACHYEG